MYRSRPSDDVEQRPRPQSVPSGGTAESPSRDSATEVLASLQHFKSRMGELVEERGAINKELGQIDLLILARRTRDLTVSTRMLLENNVNVLYAEQPPRVTDTLFAHLDYADAHVAKALSHEYLFEVIKQRLYMATALADFVIRSMDDAMTAVEAKVTLERR